MYNCFSQCFIVKFFTEVILLMFIDVQERKSKMKHLLKAEWAGKLMNLF